MSIFLQGRELGGRGVLIVVRDLAEYFLTLGTYAHDVQVPHRASDVGEQVHEVRQAKLRSLRYAQELRTHGLLLRPKQIAQGNGPRVSLDQVLDSPPAVKGRMSSI
jgi:hypothetical protein